MIKGDKAAIPLIVPKWAHSKLVTSNKAKQCLGPALSNKDYRYPFLPTPKLDTLLDLVYSVVTPIEAKGVEVKGIVTSCPAILKLLLAYRFPLEPAKWKGKTPPSPHVYQGAYFEYKIPRTDRILPIVIIPDVTILLATQVRPKFQFLMDRYIRKLTDPAFPASPALLWEHITTQEQFNSFYQYASKAEILAIDIETMPCLVHPSNVAKVINSPELRGIWQYATHRTKKGSKSKRSKSMVIPEMDMVGYTAVVRTPGGLTSFSAVIDVDSMQELNWIRKLNMCKPPKVLQNGKYDIAYLLRYNAPIFNYTCDTYIAMHSYYVELGRKLHEISAFFLRDHMYWKDESGGESRREYCVKDTHATAWAWVIMMQEYPDWAQANYRENFPMIFPCITCNLEGFLADEQRMIEHRDRTEAEIAYNRGALDRMVQDNFNPNSSPQVKVLINALRPKGKSYTAADAKTLTAFADTSPINSVLAKHIMASKKGVKAVSNYFKIDLFVDRIFYSQDPAGTDTGRSATRESEFFCGAQIQNVPVYAKDIFIVDEGWELSALDNSQSESRCTAYMSEDDNLMHTVETAADFHKTNASLFFGLPVDQITKPIRTLSKRTNHGANYNMGASVMLDTMGARAVIEAKQLIGMPSWWGLLDVTANLLQRFDLAYPDIKDKYYPEVIEEVNRTSMLTGPTGWTRYTFMKLDLAASPDPSKAKSQKLNLNSLVAHGPQSLSVKLINKAMFLTWKRLQIVENKIRMKAQVHDELMYMNRPEDRDYCADVVSEFMALPCEVRGRTMIIPNDRVLGGKTWADLKD